MVPVPCLMYSANLVAVVSGITDAEKQCLKGGYFHILSLEQPEQQIFHHSQAAVLWTMSCSHTDTNITDL